MADGWFGPYRLDALLGRGGMGEVFRAFDAEHERVVALKRLAPHLADDPDFRVRFKQLMFRSYAAAAAQARA